MGRMTVVNLLFSFNGRINRAKFYVGLVLIYALHTVAYGVALVLNGMLEWGMAADELYFLSCAWSTVGLFWPTFALYAKRVHDVGRSAFFALLAMIGEIVYVFDQLVYQMGWTSQGWVWLGGGMFLFLLLASSDNGKNFYGEEPSGTRLTLLLKLSSM